MATEFHMNLVEQAINYTFRQKTDLRISLTAAGSDPENHDGNRKLARVGLDALQLLISEGGYAALWTQGRLHCRDKHVTTKSNL